MFLKLILLYVIIEISSAQFNESDWDLAVATDRQIEFLLENGTVIGTTKGDFTKLKALTFDTGRQQLIVSDMVIENDTIYAIELTENNGIYSIISDLPDDVQGLAVDPIEDVLYWTDSNNHTINYLPLNVQKQQANTLFVFETAKPQDITIDVCNRYLYWTNSDRRKPSIERAKIGTLKTEVIVDNDLGMPAGITIDYDTQRLYWADIGEGIYYRIESTNLNGKERQVVYKGTHKQPFSISVKNNQLYFTDLRSNALWKLNLSNVTQLTQIHRFPHTPMGLIVKKTQVKSLSDCHKRVDDSKNYAKAEVELPAPYLDHTNSSEAPITCINGTLIDGVCKCSKGFSGSFCEISVCHNYCLKGSCYLTNQSFPYCHCPMGFGGTRCERDCNGYCLNGGKCKFSFPNSRLPGCTCRQGFAGPRCEENMNTKKLCDWYCENGRLKNGEDDFSYCMCSNSSNIVIANQASSLMAETENSFVNYVHDPVFISLGCVTIFSLTACIVLTVCILYLRRKPKPKIKRRYIVNKHPPTSMTERPSHSEQCEITIEDCCNMNICETPCFEPSRLRSYQQNRNDDKKMLLPNMENQEDLY